VIDYMELIKALQWTYAEPNVREYEWRTGGRLGITSSLVYRMSLIKIEDIPRVLEHKCWSNLTVDGYECIVVPYMMKRMELGV
jgi:hypothetical protein